LTFNGLHGIISKKSGILYTSIYMTSDEIWNARCGQSLGYNFGTWLEWGRRIMKIINEGSWCSSRGSNSVPLHYEP
jgi:hypothetical protein